MLSFQIEKSHINSCEAKIISLYCLKNNLKKEFLVEPKFDENTISFGSVDFCEKFYGMNFVPNYYPEFLNRFISRKIWQANILPIKYVFAKPYDKYKRFSGKILQRFVRGAPECVFMEEYRGPYWLSEIVEFSKEWRVYVANGKILAQYFYLGEEEDIPPPKVKVKFPNNFCGAVDFGMLNNRIELIESHHPFAIGWYGGFSEGEKYIEFLKTGHKYLLTLRKNSL
jgi:hypothetical protein